MKKFRDLSDRIQTLIIGLIVIASMIVGFFAYSFVSAYLAYPPLTANEIKDRYEHYQDVPFPTFRMVDRAVRHYDDGDTFSIYRLKILNEMDAKQFESGVKTSKLWHPLSSMLEEDR